MKKTLLITLATAALLSSCTQIQEARQLRQDRRSYVNPFYLQYLGESDLDRNIYGTMLALRENPRSAVLHNQLGALLFQREFMDDARTEFHRAIDADRRFYPAWYNLGMIHYSQGDLFRAKRAFSRTLRYKPGHEEAHFQLGLIYEKMGRKDAAVEHYARALEINRQLLDVHRNPRIVESKLIPLALIRLYPDEHRKLSTDMQGAPSGYRERERERGLSEQPTAEEIVSPSAPVTEEGVQKQP